MRTIGWTRAVGAAVAAVALTVPRPAAAETLFVASAADGGLATFYGPVGRGTLLTDGVAARLPEPRDLAVGPDGQAIYVLSGDALTTVDAGTRAVGPRIPVGAQAGSHLAVSPDGRRVLVTNPATGTLTTVDTTAGVAGAPVGVSHPVDLALTPDGATAYVLTSGSALTPVDVATGTPGPPIALSHPGAAIAITPDGTLAVIAEAARQGTSAPGPSTMQVVDLTTGQAEPPVALDANGAVSMTLTADGETAYVADSATNLLPFDVASRTVGAPVVNRTPEAGVDTSLSDLVATVTGGHVFGTIPCADRRCSGGVAQLDFDAAGAGRKAAEFDAGTGSNLGSAPSSLALAPNPHAVLGAVGNGTPLGERFSAGFSSNDGGSITSATLSFGDGSPDVTTTGAVGDVDHSFPAAGTYTVRLTTTNRGGCADHAAYTGQSLACTGSPTATATRLITVPVSSPSVTPPSAPIVAKPGVVASTGTLLLRATALHLKGTRARVALHCASGKSCRGRLRLSIRDARRPGRTVTCGRVTLALRAHTTARAQLPVGATCRSRLRHATHGRLAATLASSLTSGQTELARTVSLRRA